MRRFVNHERGVSRKQISSRLELEIERRFLVIGRFKSKTWTAIITRREDHVRLITVRRSRKSEENLALSGFPKRNHA